jgi:hypothetical protein
MVTLETRCRSGHYVAAVMAIDGDANPTKYHVLVFRQGHEVYQQTAKTLDDAIRSASAYLDWQSEQDFDS